MNINEKWNIESSILGDSLNEYTSLSGLSKVAFLAKMLSDSSLIKETVDYPYKAILFESSTEDNNTITNTIPNTTPPTTNPVIEEVNDSIVDNLKVLRKILDRVVGMLSLGTESTAYQCQKGVWYPSYIAEHQKEDTLEALNIVDAILDTIKIY